MRGRSALSFFDFFFFFFFFFFFYVLYISLWKVTEAILEGLENLNVLCLPFDSFNLW